MLNAEELKERLYNAQDFMTSLVCFMVEYQDPTYKRLSTNEAFMTRLLKNSRGREMPAWCFHLQHGSRICSIRSNKAPRMALTVHPILTELADKEKDIVVMNFGAW